MLYYLFHWLHESGVPGAGVFEYISFRSGASIVTALFIMLFLGKPFIRWMKNKMGMMDEVRTELGLEGAARKSQTPTMGGLLILAAIIIPTLLFAKLDNIYVLIMLGTTVWMGMIGFLDDYLKKTRGKAGLPGKYKVLGQVLLGLVVGLLIMHHPSISGSTTTTIPFVKNNEFDYAWLVTWMGDWASDLVWVVYVLIIILIVTAVSNASNLTDGIDGIATGVAAVNGGALALLAWVSGNIVMAGYLNIMYLSNIGELAIFSTAFVGATLGFLWYNGHPADVFMGDTGSLAIGSIIAVFAVLIKKELLLPVLCGIYVVENLSVIIQTSYCKYYRRRHRLPSNQPVPVEKRPFLMTPLHHHYQKKGVAEEKVVIRFIIIAILLAIFTLSTLKLR
ncbi:MAG: phospho-N-acetylmuramoyl-pentapeptide-transferase [Bacteroidales bacterium]|nr:phospho-N-acetylmuramoyl-pentapeptide-transferase [Bacteroidales bacterium]